MKKSLVMLFLFCCLLSAKAQAQIDESTIFSNMRAMYQDKDILMEGEGFDILIREYKYNSFMGLAENDERARFSFAKNLLSVYMDADMNEIESNRIDSNLYIYKRKTQDKDILKVQTAYIYKIGSKKLKGIRFIKELKTDTLSIDRQFFPEDEMSGSYEYSFYKPMVTAIRYGGIPDSIFVSSRDSVVYILGKKVVLPKIEDKKAKGRRMYYFSSLKSLRGYNDDRISWDSFQQENEAIADIESQVSQLKRGYAPLLGEAKDTVAFRGKDVPAYRIHTRYSKSGFQRYGIRTNYFLYSKVGDKNVILNVGFNEDSLRNVNGLPPFIEENFIQLKSRLVLPPMIGDSIKVSDTIYVKQKIRWPVWTYHNNHTRINGISLGFMSAPELGNRNVTTNGLKFEAIGTSVVLPIAIPMATIYSFFSLPEIVRERNRYSYNNDDENESSGIGDGRKEVEYARYKYKNRMMTTNGIDFSTLGSYSENAVVNGFSIGGLAHGGHRMNGLSVAGLSSMQGYMNGMQIGGILAVSPVVNGLQISSVFSYSHQMNGVQVGLINNSSFQIKGIQLGGFNRTGEIHGLQIGIFNNAKILKGIQIGIWNKNKKRSLPFINWGF